jgi:hypothetical protein
MRAIAGLVSALALLAPPSALAQRMMPAEFVDAATVVEGLAVDMRYFGTDNFVGARIDGYEAPRCLLARRAAAALAAVQRDLAGRGFGLKVFDCYRPVRAVAHFVRWAHDATDVARKTEYYPDIDKRDLFRLDYIAERSHLGAAAGRAGDRRRRYGHAVRFLQPEIMARGQARERGGAAQPGATCRRDDARWLSPLRQGMVALRA